MEAQLKSLNQASKTKIGKIESLIGRNMFAQALEEIKKLENREQIEQFSTEWADLFYLSATALHGLGDYKQAEAKAKKAYELLKNTSENRKVAQTQYILGLIYSDLGDLKNAETYLRDAITTYRRIGDQAQIIECQNRMARIFFMKSDYPKATEYLKEIKELSEEIGNFRMSAIASRNLGRLYILIGKWEEAEENLLYGLESIEEGDELNLCRAQLSLGFIGVLKRNFQKAQEYLSKAFQLAYKNNYLRELAIYHEYAGELAFDQGNDQSAKMHYAEAIQTGQMAAPEGDINNQTYRLLAELQVAKKEYDQALISCQKSLEVSQSIGEKIEEGAAHRILGQIYSAKKDKELAKEYFNKSILCLQQIGAKYELAKTYLEAGRSKEFDYYKRLAFLSNAEIEFRGLGSFYHLGQVNLSIANLLAEYRQYDKAQLFLSDAEKFFQETKEQKAVCEVCDLRHTLEDVQFQASKIAKSNGRVTFANIITQSDEMREIVEKLKQIKDYDISILLEGETGTGKDFIAKAIHFSSKRKDNRFIAVSCAALPETLLENELFGHKKGAYTGADKDESGLFEEAEGGTLYLDEIAEVPMCTQVKLLRAIEEKEIVRLGETKPRRINARIISSTSRDLKKLINEGTFRQDLYYRLNTFHIKIPSLAQRKDDIPLMVRHFLREYGMKEGDLKGFDVRKAVRRFLQYDWPGNVRELENELKRMVVLLQGGNGDPAKLLSEKLHKFSQKSVRSEETEQFFSSNGGNQEVLTSLSLFQEVVEFEKEKIMQALSQTNGIKLRAAKLLGIPEATLRNKMKKYGIKLSTVPF
jgi:transcriptional regulator with PAS, ATPase and Fis domain